MNKNNTDLNLFKVFAAIYQQRNLTRAAEVLSVTQPAVSNALNRLRLSFNDQLFMRTHQGMTPTPFAESIIERVQEALQLLNSSVSSKESFDPATSKRRFRISMNNLIECMLLPRLIREAQKTAPSVRFDCYEVPRKEAESELGRGSIDLVLDATLPTPGSQLESHTLKGDTIICVVSKDHPTVGDSLSLEEYLNLQHVVIPSKRTGLSYEDHALKRLGHRRQIALSTTHFNIAPMVVQKTDLSLTITRSFAEQYDLKILPLPFHLEPIDWHVHWHKSTHDDPANNWLRELVIKLVS